MYNQPYFIPGYFNSTAPLMMNRAMGMGSTMNRAIGMGNAFGNAMNGTRMAAQGAGKGLGLFSRLGNSMRAIRGVNWGGLITNASKTLNVVNQAIPLVRQVGPMMNNMKSMLRIASIFKDETDKKPVQQRSKVTNSNNYNENKINNNRNVLNNNVSVERNSNVNTEIKEKDSYNNSPTFFVSS